MRHKCKLSFSVLMISYCFVQVTSAGKSRNAGLARLTSIVGGEKVPKGSALITESLIPSNNITISDGSVEIIDNGKVSMGATVEKGGKQIVTRGATAIGTKILGGKQLVFEDESFVDLENLKKRSSAYNATVSGGGGGVGQQNVYDGAMVWKTTVTRGGEQNLYIGPRKEGGIAEGTIVSGNGRQHILEEGRATNTTLNDEAVQVAYPGGVVDGLTINGHASAWLHVGTEVTGEIKVNGTGYLYLYAGDRTDHTTKEKLSVTGRSDETLFLVGERNNTDNQINMESLSGNGGTVSFSSIPYDPRHISLHVEKLSGNLNFHFNISGSNSDYLWIDSGAGNHKINVADSGVEITGHRLQKNGIIEINLVTDRSGGADFTLIDRSGKKIEAFDGGTYMYGLYKRERSANFSGDSTTWYLGKETAGRSGASSLPVDRKPKTRVALATSSNDASTGSQSHWDSSSSRRTGSNPQTANGAQNLTQTPKKRSPRHLREAQHPPVSPIISSPEDPAFGAIRPAGDPHSYDEQQKPIVSAEAQSLAEQMIMRPSYQDQSSLQSSQELSSSDFLTTPSTDAVLSMFVAPGLVFHNELQTVRVGRGTIDKVKKNTALWTYAIKSKEKVATGYTDFKLEQMGLVLGISGLSELMDGEFHIGGFGSYDQTRVMHARGGMSGINTYSIGAYATYFDQSGWYLDGVLKYNHYQNHLKAVSTNGLAIEGNYNQWGLGTSFEVGYRFKPAQSSWIQPYAQFTWLQVEGKEIKLSNEMTGDMNPFTSLRSEVGLFAGYEVCSGGGASSMAYITAAWVRENRNSNHTTINKLHRFTTDLSGNAGRLGIGLSSFVSKKLKLYAEAHYGKGRKTKQSLQGVLGVRYSF
ncbi:BafA family autotransporter [Bartonella quintana]|uniref:BafA family autotransporter n=1 Tax=Bartonella quintana TaxID=803 RepID=UPI001ABA1FA2|nr:BafA family autotransporter [Bartonella quintana]